jgi:hypothetical protein
MPPLTPTDAEPFLATELPPAAGPQGSPGIARTARPARPEPRPEPSPGACPGCGGSVRPYGRGATLRRHGVRFRCTRCDRSGLRRGDLAESTDAGPYIPPDPADAHQYHAEMTPGGFGPDDLSPSDRDLAACESYLSRWLDENDPR